MIAKYVACLPIISVLFSSFGHAQTGSDAARIRQVDFYNFTYQPSCGGEKPGKSVQVKDGLYRQSIPGREDFIYLKIAEIIFGDLTGDKREEAVVVTWCNTGGTATFSEGLIYTMQNERIQLIARLKDGDFADGGVAKVKIIDGLLKVDRFAPSEKAAHCCPDFITTTTYRWDDNRLVQVGLTERRKVEPGKLSAAD